MGSRVLQYCSLNHALLALHVHSALIASSSASNELKCGVSGFLGACERVSRTMYPRKMASRNMACVRGCTCEAETEVHPRAVALHDQALLVVQRIQRGPGARQAPAHLLLHGVVEGLSLLLLGLCSWRLALLGRRVLDSGSSACAGVDSRASDTSRHRALRKQGGNGHLSVCAWHTRRLFGTTLIRRCLDVWSQRHHPFKHLLAHSGNDRYVLLTGLVIKYMLNLPAELYSEAHRAAPT